MTKHALNPGDTVFIRWQGSAEFELIERIDQFIFPHWTCKKKVGDEVETWIVPQIHVSTKNLELLTEHHNHKQLSLSDLNK